MAVRARQPIGLASAGLSTTWLLSSARPSARSKCCVLTPRASSAAPVSRELRAADADTARGRSLSPTAPLLEGRDGWREPGTGDSADAGVERLAWCAAWSVVADTSSSSPSAWRVTLRSCLRRACADKGDCCQQDSSGWVLCTTHVSYAKTRVRCWPTHLVAGFELLQFCVQLSHCCLLRLSCAAPPCHQLGNLLPQLL